MNQMNEKDEIHLFKAKPQRTINEAQEDQGVQRGQRFSYSRMFRGEADVLYLR